jgi:hypothetical protein
MAKRRSPGIRMVVIWTLAGLAAVTLIVFALWVGPWLFTRHPENSLTIEQELKARNDVRTTLVQALAGLAVAGGLVVTYRTYRQNQGDQERSYQQRLAEEKRRQAEQDRTYERELYAKAVEQLGHEQAPVRLGALYSLESLAQDRPHRRQTVVDVLCAYLRMPYTPSTDPDPGGQEEAARQPAARPSPARDPAQELQVRKTAQRLLARHLRGPDGAPGDAQRRPPTPDETFWPGISLDLTGATLVELDLEEVSVVTVTFDRAIFIGPASFEEAIFTGHAFFSTATFAGGTMFDRATFADTAGFTSATFGRVGFPGVTFTREAWFDGVTFTDEVVLRLSVDDRAEVLHLDDPDLSGQRSWPPGWTIRPDPTDPSRGTLHELTDEHPEQRVAPSD